jgi:hypothetical protein
MRRIPWLWLLPLPVLVASCSGGSEDDAVDGAAAADAAAGGDGGGDGTLAERYPGDVGIAGDPAVVWYEGFEQASAAALGERYDQARTAGVTFDADTPLRSPGVQSARMSAGGAFGDATDLYTRLPGAGHDVLYVRYYVKHEDAPYHHTGVWLGGYEPVTAWPSPQAGSRPDGDDRLSVAIEPMNAVAGGLRLDFYNYWMRMRSWQSEPASSYYGNTKVNRDEVLAPLDAWVCVEILVRLNDDPASAAGGQLALWIDDALVYHYDQQGPLGYHVADKFCPADATSSACAPYAPPEGDRTEILDLQWRSTTDLRLNYLWVQNYISQGSGAVWFDDLVAATTRIGCIY